MAKKVIRFIIRHYKSVKLRLSQSGAVLLCPSYILFDIVLRASFSTHLLVVLILVNFPDEESGVQGMKIRLGLRSRKTGLFSEVFLDRTC